VSSADVTITLLGDLMLGGDFSAAADQLVPNMLPPDAATWIRSDLVVANLEAAFSDRGAPTPDKILVHALPQAAPALQHLGVDVVNLANNHLFDYGLAAVRDTQAILDDLGVGWFGAGADIEEAARPWVTEVNAATVAMVGFSWTDQWVQPAPAATPTEPGVNPLQMDHVETTIERINRDLNPDRLVVSLHWGEGMSRWPRPDAVRQARRIVEMGADVVMGHHPHCLQPYEVVDKGVILYSLGNFIASRYTKTAESRLTYGEGTTRGRTSRERLTVATRVHLGGATSVDYLPLVQNTERPVLQAPTSRERQVIDRVFRDRGEQVSRADYGRRYWYRRRFDEVVQKLEEVREQGWGSFTWRTPFRALRRLVTGRNMH
jgi:poly-gamma-glutamate synthesis protein (capsule biosynthesis protein)